MEQLYSPGDVITAPFTFTEKNEFKNRPAVVLSSSEYNDTSKEIICCAITSNLSRKDGILIVNKDIIGGTLLKSSQILPAKILSIAKQNIRLPLGYLNNETLELVKNKLSNILDL